LTQDVSETFCGVYVLLTKHLPLRQLFCKFGMSWKTTKFTRSIVPTRS